MARLAVCASGIGSILEAICTEVPVALVVTDRTCRAFSVAQSLGIPTTLVRRDFGPSFDRVAYSNRLLRVLKEHAIDFVALAGFMTVLTGRVLAEYEDRILNTHPSLLPDFQGSTDAVADAYHVGVKRTGFTVHYVTETLDGGRIVAQKKVPILQDDTLDMVRVKVKVQERRYYPSIIREEMEKIGQVPA